MSEYPLEELVKIKKKRFEQAIKLVEEKKSILKRETVILKNLELERDKVLKHKNDKLKQLRDALDAGERTDKIRQKKDYLEVVKENLLEKEKKVLSQLKNVKEAEIELEKARKNLFEKQKDIEKLSIHKGEWQKEMKILEGRLDEAMADEIGSQKFTIKKKK